MACASLNGLMPRGNLQAKDVCYHGLNLVGGRRDVVASASNMIIATVVLAKATGLYKQAPLISRVGLGRDVVLGGFETISLLKRCPSPKTKYSTDQ